MLEPIKSRPWAIILAAGKGSRLASQTGNIPKQFILFKNKPLYWYSAQKFSSSSLISGLVIVFPRENFEEYIAVLENLNTNNALGLPLKTAIGGPERGDSVYSGLLQIPSNSEHVIIHDAARPFFKNELIANLCKMLDRNIPAVIPGIPVTDTIKICEDSNLAIVKKTLPRDKLIAVQTPQAFKTACLLEAYKKNSLNSICITDDAVLMENNGYKVSVIRGDPTNIKITYSKDLAMLQSVPKDVPCSGFGYDVHRYGVGRVLKLGGIEIPGNIQIIAHSDGDVLLHALMDAILGCGGLGDIGQIFPDDDPVYDGISSAVLLNEVLSLAEKAGIKIYQADLTLVAQKPHIGKYKDEIRKNIARLLNLPKDKINLKATTEEGLGFTGAVEGVKAYALVNCWRKAVE